MEITNFTYGAQPVRTVLIDGEPAFLAGDVCAILDLANVGMALASLDEDEKGSITITDGTPGNPNKAYVSEAGMYSLVLRSRKPEAKAFKRWITHEVLPSIRKTGSYAAPALTGPELMARALIEAQSTLEAKTREVAALTPKAEAFDALLSTTGDYSVNEAAKALARDHNIQIGEGRLRARLEEWGWIYRHSGKPRAKQAQVDLCRLAEKARWHYHPETGEKVLDSPQVRITAKGIAAIRDKMLAPMVIAA